MFDINNYIDENIKVKWLYGGSGVQIQGILLNNPMEEINIRLANSEDLSVEKIRMLCN